MPTHYTGNPTATETPSPAPGPGQSAIVVVPNAGEGATAASVTQAMKVAADWPTALFGPYYAPGFFFDGRDGNLTFDGTSTVLGLVPSSSSYMATRDIYANNCTVTGASTRLQMNGFRLYVKGTLTTVGGAKVTANGNAAAGTTPGAASGVGTVGGGGIGANPGTSGAAGNETNSFGGVGGTGGTGAGSAIAPGTVTAPAATLGSVGPQALGQLIGGGAMAAVSGGAGGGGGAGGVGGGGGGGGGVLAIAARTLSLANASDLQAAGGAAGSATSGNSGGGGGGGGGVMILVYGSKNAVTFSAATNCPGGALGNGFNTGTAGTAGANGTVFEMALS